MHDATALAGQLASGEISARELTEASIARIEAADGDLNAVVVRDFDRARKAASEADEHLASGMRLPLLGVPVTIKESFDVAGLPTSWGLEAFRNSIATEDAVAVARLRAARAIILGKTNVSEGLDGWNASNPVYGATGNPLGAGLSPGGSSSGAAASVAAGYVPLDIGSDLGGSIRGPAQFCGIYGHVASGGLIPLRGHALAGRKARFDLSCPGPFARSARDLDLALGIMAGPDGDEAAGYHLDLAPPRTTTLRGLRVLVLDRHPMVATDPEVRAAVNETADILERDGAEVRPANDIIPDVAALTRTYLALLGGAIALGMSKDALAALDRQRADIDPQSITGLKLAGMVASHAKWLEANEERVKLRWAFREVFERHDLLICPAFSVPVITEEQSRQPAIEIDGVLTPRGDSVAWTALGNTAGLPATVVPVGKTVDGRPVSVQIIGPYLEDRTTIAVAKMLAASVGI
jgi:amidase